jgi:hypothetical protein
MDTTAPHPWEMVANQFVACQCLRTFRAFPQFRRRSRGRDRSCTFLAKLVDVVLSWALYFVGGHEHEGFGIAS